MNDSKWTWIVENNSRSNKYSYRNNMVHTPHYKTKQFKTQKIQAKSKKVSVLVFNCYCYFAVWNLQALHMVEVYNLQWKFHTCNIGI